MSPHPYRARTVLPIVILALVLFGVIFFPLVYANSTTQAQAVPALAASKKYIAFRDDDVAPTSKLAALKAVNDVHIAHNVPVTLGIVPHPYPAPGNGLLVNPHFLAYMRSIETSPLFEFAQHGYTHKDNLPGSGNSEFAGQSYDEQLATLRAGQADMSEAFGLTPATFIPPFNAGDTATLRAAATLGFKGYSAGAGNLMMTRDETTGLALSSAPITFDEHDLSAITSSTGDLLDAAPAGSTIVVLYHVWGFVKADGTVNTQTTQTLALYMEYLKNRGDVDFVRLDYAAEHTPHAYVVRAPWESSSAEAGTTEATAL